MRTPPSCVVITGASSGFGVEFARRFAAAGSDLVIVARRLDRLDALAHELRAAYGVAVYPVALDLAESGAADALMSELAEKGLTPDGLVNNAGLGIDGPFVESDSDRLRGLLHVNVLAVAELTHRMLPAILAADHGVLVNVASTASYQPIPNIALYAASKAFVRTLTEAIWQEAKSSRARVLALSPGPTQTEFFDAAGSERFKIGQMLTIEQVVDHAFHALNNPRSGPTRIAGWRNAVQAAMPRLVPTRMALAITAGLTED